MIDIQFDEVKPASLGATYARERGDARKGRMRTRVVIVGAVWLVAVIATWIYLASDGLHCQYFHDQTACARLEWQSALTLAKKRIEAPL